MLQVSLFPFKDANFTLCTRVSALVGTVRTQILSVFVICSTGCWSLCCQSAHRLAKVWPSLATRWMERTPAFTQVHDKLCSATGGLKNSNWTEPAALQDQENLFQTFKLNFWTPTIIIWDDSCQKKKTRLLKVKSNLFFIWLGFSLKIDFFAPKSLITVTPTSLYNP